MTRETKIGLLVGLAFIILIGILLSDHLAVNNDPTQAQLAQVNGNVQQGIGSPVPQNQTNTTMVTSDGRIIAPQNPITTQQETIQRQTPPSVVVLDGNNNSGGGTMLSVPVTGNTGTGTVTIGRGTPGTAGGQQPYSTTINPVPTDFVTPVSGGQVPTDIQRAIDQAGMGTIQPGPINVTGGMNPVPPQPGNVTPPPAANTRQYTVKTGDNLSKIAAAFYGRGDKTNMQRIIDANPSLKKNPNMIVVGQTYVIPNVPAPAPSTPAPTPAPIPQTTPVPPTQVVTHDAVTPTETPRTPPAQQAAETVYYYTVKESDTLWKIATVQLGDGAKSKDIIALNKDVLGGGSTIRVGQKLRLPARPLADVR